MSSTANTNIGFWEEILRNPTPAFRELINAEYQYLVERVPVHSQVLDVGCGDGRNIDAILRNTDYVTGIDNDESAVDRARNHFINLTNVKIIKAEATMLPFGDGIFDVVVLFDILQNLDSAKEKVLAEAKRVLKDGGMVLLSAYSEDAFKERMKMYGIVNLPIAKIEGTRVLIDKSGGGHISEQFSLNEIVGIVEAAGLKIVDSRKVSNLAYLCALGKVGV